MIRLSKYSDKEALSYLYKIDKSIKIYSCKELIGFLDSPNHNIYMAEENGIIVGYMVYSWSKEYFLLIDIVVHPERRRRKHATDLFIKLKERLTPRGRNRIVYYSEESNILSQLFLKYHNFRAFNVSDGYILFKYCLAFNYKEKSDGVE